MAYNGWTNYETWLVNLWMGAGQGSREFFRGQAREIYDSTDLGPHRGALARLRFAGWLKEHYDENIPEMPGVYNDLLGVALGAVNWIQIARHYIDAVREEVADANA